MLVAPQILAVLVAAVLFTAGLAAWSFAYRLRRATSGWTTVEARPVEPLSGDPFYEFLRRF